MATESGGSIKPVAVVILGADALLAVRPAAPIQLWHACLAAGYDLAVPATFGDELIAAECLRALGAHPEPVTVMCSCPLVARAVGEGDADLSAHLVSLVAPPVATARYLRRVYGDRRVHITFIGACPSAADSAIDAWHTPGEFLARLAVNDIDVARQPQLFDSVLPPDRRRHLSQPGGLPTAARAAALPRSCQVAEVVDADVMASLRRHVMSGVRTLIDVAPRFGCACSGVTSEVPAAEARAAVMALEPPRSTRPVMTDPGGLGLLRRVAPRASVAIQSRASADEGKPVPGGRESTAREAEHRVATPRPASRSPLSWTLRERALPQPPTPPPAAASIDPGLDPVTVAAVRAIESAANPSDRSTAATGGVTPGHDAPGTESPGADRPPGGAQSAAPEPGDRGERSRQSSRPTPPGGYWFVAAPTPGAPDSEVARETPSVGADRALSGSAADAGGSAPSDAGDGADVPPAQPPEGGEMPAADTRTSAGTVGSDLDGAGVDATSAEDAGSAEAAPVDGATSSTEAIGGQGEEPARNSVSTESQPDAITEPRGGHDGEPPDRPWVVVMTIIVLFAGAMLARDVARRRAPDSVAAQARPERVWAPRERAKGDVVSAAARPESMDAPPPMPFEPSRLGADRQRAGDSSRFPPR